MRIKYLILFLFTFALFIYALPNLPLNGQGIAVFFSWGWILFALFTMAGNLVGFLFSSIYEKKATVQQKDLTHVYSLVPQQRRRIRER